MSFLTKALYVQQQSLYRTPFRCFALYRKAKTAHLNYTCVPDWMKPAPQDPFDY
jgi:cbb3-type cytochrome oxidase subunit 1